MLLDCAAVLFDNDGVLVDSDASVVRAWSRWALSRGLDPDVVLPMVHGRPSRETVRLLVDAAGRDEALASIDAMELDDAAAVTALPGAVELVSAIPVAAWAIVTSATRSLAAARLAAAGMPSPGSLVTADDVARGKPDREGYLAAAAALRVAVSESIVVEDSPAGIEAARAAGVRWVLGVGERSRAADPDAVVRDLRDVTWDKSGLGVHVRT